MPGADAKSRTEVRALLSRANIEIGNALTRVDSMGDFELAEVKGAAGGLVAFFDKNGTCGSAGLAGAAIRPGGGTVAFFDKNGTCGSAGRIGAVEELARAIRNVVRSDEE